MIASADPNSTVSDGDFGTFGVGGLGSTGTGFTVVPGTTVSFFDKTTGAAYQPGVNNADRAVLQIAAGTTLAGRPLPGLRPELGSGDLAV